MAETETNAVDATEVEKAHSEKEIKDKITTHEKAFSDLTQSLKDLTEQTRELSNKISQVNALRTERIGAIKSLNELLNA